MNKHKINKDLWWSRQWTNDRTELSINQWKQNTWNRSSTWSHEEQGNHMTKLGVHAS